MAIQIGVAAVVLLFFFIFISYRKRRAIEASVAQSMIVWARLGPFENGRDSAMHMFAAWHTCGAPKGSGTMKTIFEHAAHFDSQREHWEGVRLKLLLEPFDPMQVSRASLLLSDRHAMERLGATWHL